MKTLRVIVGCEMSGVVRDSFAALGHDAWSCDLLPSERPGKHLQCDVLSVLDQGWDIGIFHPPCDYLTVSGNRWFSDTAKARPGVLTGQARREAQARAVEFVKALWNCSIPRVCIENPIGRLSTLWRKPSQTIQPFQFGDPFRKATCLWLRGLPLLKPTSNLTTGEQTVWKMPPGAKRKQLRSMTYPGIARAFAEQFSNINP